MREGGRDGEGVREGGRDGEGVREGGRDGEGGREGWGGREGGREGWGGREEGREEKEKKRRQLLSVSTATYTSRKTSKFRITKSIPMHLPCLSSLIYKTRAGLGPSSISP